MSEPGIGVAILHGIGSQEPGFAASFVELVTARLTPVGGDPDLFAFHPVHWAHLFDPAEKLLLARLQDGGLLDWLPLRAFVVENLADAVAYRRGHPREWDAYHQIHWQVYSELSLLRDKLATASAPLVVMAHSLGSVIISDHIWDEHKRQGFGRDAFTRCETLAGIITFGSNIPLFTLALPEVRCIAFPPAGACLSPAVRDAARWCNYYDRDDVLGYPLRTLSPSYGATVSEDVELNAGHTLTSWTPLSHNGYWTEHRFVDSAARQLVQLQAAHGQGVRVANV